jgi:transglutaminase-like putative cysteine protease
MRVSGFVLFATVLTAASPAVADEPKYMLRVTPVQRIRAVNTFEVSCPKVVVKKWIIFANCAPELPGQTDVSSELTPNGQRSVEVGDRRRPVLMAKVKVTDDKLKSAITYTVEYKATLQARELVAVRSGAQRLAAAPLTKEERKTYLAATANHYDCDLKGFQRWLGANKLRRAEGEGDIAFARRAFLLIKRNFGYESRSDSDLHASAVCGAGQSDCHGLSVLFAATMRANDIPARCLVGKWAKSMKPGVVIGDIPNAEQHVKAEFYADGVGWVPVDQSAAVFHDKSADGLAYFGKDPGDFLAFHVDFDLTIDTGRFGKDTFDSLWFACWPKGRGDADERKQREDWQVEIIRK